MTSYRRDPEKVAAFTLADRVKGVAGHLPPAIERPLKDRDRVQREATKHAVTDHAAADAALVAEIVAGKVADLPARAAAVRSAADQDAYLAKILDQAVEEADRLAVSAIRASGDTLLDLLRGAHAAVLAEVRDVGSPLAGKDLSDPLGLPEPALAAYRQVRALATRFESIRGTHAALGRTIMGRPTYDGDGLCSEFSNGPAVWGSYIAGRMQSNFRPWPADPVERLLWIAGLASTYVAERPIAWLPTPAEQDAALRAFIEERKAS